MYRKSPVWGLHSTYLLLKACCGCCLLKLFQFSSVTESYPTFWPHGLQHASLPCSSPNLGVYSNSGPLSWSCHTTVSPSVVPFSSCPQSSPALGSFLMSQLFASGGKELELQLQHQSFQWIPRTDVLSDGLVGSPCSPRDSQESSPKPQFKSINYLALSSFYSPALTFHMTTGKTIA